MPHAPIGVVRELRHVLLDVVPFYGGAQTVEVWERRMLWLAAVPAVLEKAEQPRGATKAAEEAEQMLADTRGEIAISGSGCGSCLHA
mmetsp:Transcript_35911/g.84437  ORF Transcript_35911/g.84437 Transcript_35911/m.84437 type:complete len:87 (-) Transcript_35911:245-505(-)